MAEGDHEPGNSLDPEVADDPFEEWAAAAGYHRFRELRVPALESGSPAPSEDECDDRDTPRVVPSRTNLRVSSLDGGNPLDRQSGYTGSLPSEDCNRLNPREQALAHHSDQLPVLDTEEHFRSVLACFE